MTDSERGEQTSRNFAIRTDQEDMLIQFAKESDRSVSGALRFILDDWIAIRRAALQTAGTADEPTR